jgi:hypothetical protein
MLLDRELKTVLVRICLIWSYGYRATDGWTRNLDKESNRVPAFGLAARGLRTSTLVQDVANKYWTVTINAPRSTVQYSACLTIYGREYTDCHRSGRD